jgi:PAS domain-containing protein
MLAATDMTAQLEELQAVWRHLRAHVDQLAEERQHYHEFFEQASAAYVVSDQYGTIAEANGAAVDILQRRKRYLRGKPIAALIALERRAEFRRNMRALLGRARGAQASWSTIVVAPELRSDVIFTGRVMRRAERACGICWRLESAS